MMASENPNSSIFSLLQHQLSLHGGPSNSPPSSSSSSSSSISSSSSTSSLPFSPLLDDHSLPQDNFPHSWSQLLLSGLASGSEEEGMGLTSSPLQGMNLRSPSFDHPKLTPNNEYMWLGHIDQHHLMKQECYGHDMNHQHHEDIHDHEMHALRPCTWSSQMALPVSSPKSSCVTTLININNNIVDFSTNSCKDKKLQAQHHSSECISPASTTGSTAPKKPRVQSYSIPPLKVRKEKLGDRITALHQLVSPFGKTDTASVLLETIGCIRYLQGQIQALSSPYFSNPPSKHHHSSYVMKDERENELRSKGLCLVPISCTQVVGSEDNNTASEYWAPSIAAGF